MDASERLTPWQRVKLTLRCAVGLVLLVWVGAFAWLVANLFWMITLPAAFPPGTSWWLKVSCPLFQLLFPLVPLAMLAMVIYAIGRTLIAAVVGYDWVGRRLRLPRVAMLEPGGG